MTLVRAFPLLVRPVPFLIGLVLFPYGLLRGLNWDWESQQYLGTFLYTVVIPTHLFDVQGDGMGWILLSLLGLALIGVSVAGRRAASRGGWWAPKMRFYPTLFFLALLFLTYGTIFIFDVQFFGDESPAGSILFITLDYATLKYRLVAAIFGFLVLLAGALILFGLAWQWGTGVDRRWSMGAPAARPAQKPSTPILAAPSIPRTPPAATTLAPAPSSPAPRRIAPSTPMTSTPTPRPAPPLQAATPLVPHARGVAADPKPAPPAPRRLALVARRRQASS